MRLAALAVFVVGLVAGVATADPVMVRDGDRRWTLDLPPGFQLEEDAQVPEGTLLASFAGGGDRRVAVVRLRANTDGAQAGDKGYFAGLEDGVRGAADDYRKLSGTPRKLAGSARIPAYDLWYRSGDTLRGTRFVLLKSYALILTVHAPHTRRADKATKRILESFEPLSDSAAARP